MTPTCFGVLTPSSGSLQVLSAKVMNYWKDKIQYSSITVTDKMCKLPEDGVRTPKHVGVILISILYYFCVHLLT